MKGGTTKWRAWKELAKSCRMEVTFIKVALESTAAGEEHESDRRISCAIMYYAAFAGISNGEEEDKRLESWCGSRLRLSAQG